MLICSRISGFIRTEYKIAYTTNNKNFAISNSLSHTRQIQNVDSKNCIVAQIENKEGILRSCNNNDDSQVLIFSNIDEIRNYDLCLDAVPKDGKVKLLKCHQMRGNQKWVYEEEVHAS